MASARIPPVLVPPIQSKLSRICIPVAFSMARSVWMRIRPRIPPPSKLRTYNSRSRHLYLFHPSSRSTDLSIQTYDLQQSIHRCVSVPSRHMIYNSRPGDLCLFSLFCIKLFYYQPIDNLTQKLGIILLDPKTGFSFHRILTLSPGRELSRLVVGDVSAELPLRNMAAPMAMSVATLSRSAGKTLHLKKTNVAVLGP